MVSFIASFAGTISTVAASAAGFTYNPTWFDNISTAINYALFYGQNGYFLPGGFF